MFSAADQTPTPTRFLKNCEEVGLFNELASPFDHDFKKAAEDDIKKVLVVIPVCLWSDCSVCWCVPLILQLPLDLSPLATPIIRNKIEEPAAIDAHRDSPLPHPESTTNDDKVCLLNKLFVVTCFEPYVLICFCYEITLEFSDLLHFPFEVNLIHFRFTSICVWFCCGNNILEVNKCVTVCRWRPPAAKVLYDVFRTYLCSQPHCQHPL